MSRSPIFDGVDPGLLSLIKEVSGGYGPYGARITSGFRQGDPRQHGRGNALDVELFNRDTGAALPNYQNASAAQAYQQFANAVYAAASPELKQRLRWGGYFGGNPGKYGALDLMHFDLGGGPGGLGMLGGSWGAGFTPEQAKTWNMQAGGGTDASAAGGAGGANQMGPAMPTAKMDYTPEQRRAAIASIESAGSGDYGALGVLTGDPVEGRDRAYGRYQIMGKNIPVWSKQVLGREVTPQEFLKDPKIQDAIFDKVFGDYVQKYGEAGAASMWFSGTPNAQEDTKDKLGTTVKSYANRYLEALGGNPLNMGASYPKQPQPQNNPATQPNTAIAGASPQGSTEAPKNPMANAISDMADAVGGMFGAGKAGAVPTVAMPKPLATPTMAGPAQTLNPASVDASRQRLAQALSRLNSGKLWV